MIALDKIKIRKEIMAKGLSLGEFASLCGTSYTNISRILNSNSKASSASVVSFSKGLGITPREFVMEYIKEEQ